MSVLRMSLRKFFFLLREASFSFLGCSLRMFLYCLKEASFLSLGCPLIKFLLLLKEVPCSLLRGFPHFREGIAPFY